MTEQLDKEGVEKEAKRQLELTFSFIKSIALGISAVMLISIVVGYILMFSFVDDNSEMEGIDTVFDGLDRYFLLFIAVLCVNIAGLVLFGKSKVIGWWMYLCTSLFLIFIFIYLMDMTMFVFAGVYVCFSIIIGIYGFKRMKLN